MQDAFFGATALPFFKLAQANVGLITRFSMSPEVTAQTGANASQMVQQASASAMKLMQSGAFTQLVQGLMKNYADFLGELGQSGMAAISQGQAAWTSGVADAAGEVLEGRGRRSRQGA